jgi:uncharacterized protein YrrD
MFKCKDFFMMDVVDINGRKIGFINDLLLNFHEKKIKGFSICSYSIFSRNVDVRTEDIISFNKTMIIRKASKEKNIRFNEIKGFDVVDIKGKLLGYVDDVLFDEEYELKAFIVTTGFIKKFLKGKFIVLSTELILGEYNFLYFGDSKKMNLVCIPQKAIGVDTNEKNL